MQLNSPTQVRVSRLHTFTYFTCKHYIRVGRSTRNSNKLYCLTWWSDFFVYQKWCPSKWLSADKNVPRTISCQSTVASVLRRDPSECVTPRNIWLTCCFSGTFANQLRKATTYCFRHVLSLDHSTVSLSIRSEQTNRHPSGGFSWNSIMGIFTSFYLR